MLMSNIAGKIFAKFSNWVCIGKEGKKNLFGYVFIFWNNQIMYIKKTFSLKTSLLTNYLDVV